MARSKAKKRPKAQIKALDVDSFTDEEQGQIVTDLLTLKKEQLRTFLTRAGISKSGTKEELRERIEKALVKGELQPTQIVHFLDEIVPWGKQHIYLFNGPKASIDEWRGEAHVAALLEQQGLRTFLNAKMPLLLPASMRISSILHDKSRLRVTAIQKREWWDRNEDYDDFSETKAGDEIELRAFVRRVTRSVVAFEWDLTANIAFLQISQLPSRCRYEDVSKEFFELVAAWLDIRQFEIVDVRLAIKKLHELEEKGPSEVRSHGINYRTLEGRRLEGRSASPSDPLCGDVEIDTALGAVRRSGVGHLGNFYWLPGQGSGRNPLESEAHVIIVGANRRINFPTANGERTVRYVLSRVRSHSAIAS